MAKPASSGTKRAPSARAKGPTPRGTSTKAAARAASKAGPKPARTQGADSARTHGAKRPGAGIAAAQTNRSPPTASPTTGKDRPPTAKDSPSTVAAISGVTVSTGVPKTTSAAPGPPTPKASGRFTPKAQKTVAPPPVSTGRYTPPIPSYKRSSPPWVPVLMLSLLILGALTIVLDYLGVLPFGTSSWYLLVGLVLVAVGFGVATQYR